MNDLELQIAVLIAIGVILLVSVAVVVYVWQRFRREEAAFFARQAAAEIENYSQPPLVDDETLPKYAAADDATQHVSLFHWLGLRAPSYAGRRPDSQASAHSGATSHDSARLSVHAASRDALRRHARLGAEHRAAGHAAAAPVGCNEHGQSVHFGRRVDPGCSAGQQIRRPSCAKLLSSLNDKQQTHQHLSM
ncbi:hypothetical protein BDR26DRAFT_9174 [Obelidium mucronatum]|nr:hypothetical protein BDR26DRAFT_9174 [Obelidium mucronatum]